MLGESLSGLDLSGTTHTNAGTYPTDPWTFTDVTGNYNDASGTTADSIAKADAVITVPGYSVTYDRHRPHGDGHGHGRGERDPGGSRSLLDLSGTTHTSAGSYATDAWTFTDAPATTTTPAARSHDVITKANATIV